MEMMIMKYFIPEPDITVFELADIVANCCWQQLPMRQGFKIPVEEWPLIPPGVQRHFKDEAEEA